MTTQQRAVVAVERLLELLDGGQVEVVRRLVEHEAVHALGREAGEHGPVRSPGDSVARGARHVLGAEPELGQQRARVGDERARSRR